MSFKKVALASLFTLPSLTGFAKGQEQVRSVTFDRIDEVREECVQRRADVQTAPFKLKYECSGKYVITEERKSRFTLDNYGDMTTHVDTKNGRYNTDWNTVDVLVASQQATCSITEKFEMATPNGFGIIGEVEDCDELNIQNMIEICQEEVRDYCSNNHVDQADVALQACQTQKGAEQGQECQLMNGMCTSSVLATIDQCAGYEDATHEQQQQEQDDEQAGKGF